MMERGLWCLLLVALSLSCAVGGWAGDCTQFGCDARHSNYTSETVSFPLSLEWKFSNPPDTSLTAPVVAENSVFWTAGPYIFGIDQETGAARWGCKAPALVNGCAFYAGTVIFLTDDGYLYALRSGDGQVAWQAKVARSAHSAVALEGDTIYCATTDNQVLALEAATGRTKWSTEIKDVVYAAPAVAAGRVYVSCMDNQVYAFDAQNGKLQWNYRMPTRAGVHMEPVAGDRYLYVVTEKTLSAVGFRGVPGWRLDFRADLPAGPSYANGLVYQPGPDGVIYALEADTGKVRWRQPAGMYLSCGVTVAGDVLLTGSDSGLVRAYEAQMGLPLWEYHTWHPLLVKASRRKEDFVPVVPPVVANGALYISTAGGELLKLSPNAFDGAPPEAFNLAPEEGKPTSGALPLKIGAQVFDEGSGLDTRSLSLTLDGQALPASFSAVGSAFFHSKATGALDDGWHTAEIKAKDNRGNEMVRTWKFLVDKGYSAPAQAQSAATGATATQQPEVPPGPSGQGSGLSFGRRRD